MCNAYNLKTRLATIGEIMARIGLPLSEGPQVDFNLTDDVYPGLDGLILRPVDPTAPDEGLAADQARWGLIPFYHRKTLKDWKCSTNNAKAETVAASAVFKGPLARRRCLVPFDGFYEWTGPKGRKTKHRISPADGSLRSFAGLWDRAETEDGLVESYTIITCPP
jgi:putative SOS response-associated peptidase YedK